MGVSKLGTMLKIFLFPEKSANDRSFNYPLTKEKSGAVEPMAGRSPDVFSGLP